MSGILQITKTGYKKIGTVKKQVVYQTPRGRFTSRRAFTLSARTEPYIKRYRRAYEFRPPELPEPLVEVKVQNIENVLSWKKREGIGHIGVGELKVES